MDLNRFLKHIELTINTFIAMAEEHVNVDNEGDFEHFAKLLYLLLDIVATSAQNSEGRETSLEEMKFYELSFNLLERRMNYDL